MQVITSTNPVKTYPPSARPKNRALIWTRRVLLGVIITLAALGALGAAYQALASQADRRSFPPPGQLYDVGGYRLHLNCTGPQDTGVPPVILDTLSGGSSVNWGWVQPEIAKTTRVCSYDRAGFGWSDPVPQPLSFRQTVSDLHTLLAKANVPGPYVLVGHSKGGPIVRGFAQQYPAETAGLVLVDASQPDQFLRYPELLNGGEAFLRQSRSFPLFARLGLFHLLFALGGELDFADLPAREHDALAAFWSSPAFWEAQRAEVMTGEAFFSQAQGEIPSAPGALRSLSLAVVSAGTNAHPEMQAELAALSSNSIHITVEGATHTSLAFNREDAGSTISAINQVVEAVRMGEPLQAK